MYVLYIRLSILYRVYIDAKMPMLSPCDRAIRRHAIPGILLRASHPAESLPIFCRADASRHERFPR